MNQNSIKEGIEEDERRKEGWHMQRNKSLFIGVDIRTQIGQMRFTCFCQDKCRQKRYAIAGSSL